MCLYKFSRKQQKLGKKEKKLGQFSENNFHENEKK